MRFVPLGIDGAWLVSLEPLTDERGWFARSFAREEFEGRGLEPAVVHGNTSFSSAAGTWRGLHHQLDPHGEAKLIRCVRGAVHDVAVDLRTGSRTFREAISVELREGGFDQVYLPAGVAHGFLTLEPDTEVTYLMSEGFVAEAAAGVRWDDPAFAVTLPRAITVISERDASYPDFTW